MLTQRFAAMVLTSTSAVLKKCWLNGVAQKGGVWSILFTEQERLLTLLSTERDKELFREKTIEEVGFFCRNGHMLPTPTAFNNRIF